MRKNVVNITEVKSFTDTAKIGKDTIPIVAVVSKSGQIHITQGSVCRGTYAITLLRIRMHVWASHMFLHTRRVYWKYSVMLSTHLVLMDVNCLLFLGSTGLAFFVK